MHHMAEYTNHAPPRHIPPSMKHIKPKPKRTRKVKPPASLSKLHRPLTRFYCNDCKKKFRSRILANRNNNAVQHYCSLYSKIITRKVDSHSNKCKGDHGMGPCVVKRTDVDPDSDGEDETKAAYYADKGKAPRSTRKSRGAYSKSDKKRKRSDDDDNNQFNQYNDPQTKRARISSPPPVEPMGYYPHPPSNHHGYYNQNGYMMPENGVTRPPYNHINDQMNIDNNINNHNNHNGIPPPPPIDDYNESSLPPPPIIESKSDKGQSGSPPAQIPMPLMNDYENGMNGMNGMNGNMDSGPLPPPPPPLEEFAPLPVPPSPLNQDKNGATNGHKNGHTNDNETENGNIEESKQEEHIDNVIIETPGNDDKEQKEEIENISFDKITKNGTKSMIELNGITNNVEDEDCINIGSDDDDLPDLKVPNSSPSPSAKQKKVFSLNLFKQQQADEDDDLILSLPLS